MPSSLQHFRLTDGRELAWTEWGDPEGTPVLFFHGLPSCRLMHPDSELSRSRKVRLITVDRPGFGHSDPKPGHTLVGWADDVAEFSAGLGIQRFALAGASGGGPFVAACAWKLPERVTRAAILGGSGPVDAPGAMEGIAWERRAGYWLARHAPWLFKLAVQRRGDPRKDPEVFFAQYTRHNPPADQELLAQPAVRKMFLASYQEATRQGLDAFAWEVQLVSRSWGFALPEISVPLTLWHGDLDNSTPLGMSRALAQQIPGSQLRVISGAGHLLFLSHWAEILDDLLAPSPGAAPR